MFEITLFLIVLIIALVIGNLALFVSRPSKGEKQLRQIQLMTNSSQIPEEQGNEKFLKFQGANETIQTHGSIAALNQKVLMAHNRLNDLEKNFLNSPSFESTSLNKKIQSMEEFQGKTQIELAALKEVLLKGQLPKKVDRKKLKTQILKAKKQSNNLDKKIHEWAFHKA